MGAVESLHVICFYAAQEQIMFTFFVANDVRVLSVLCCFL